MATRPSEYPRWADVSGDIVDPPSGKKDVGWVDDEEPANEFFNWHQNNVYQWIQYFDTRYNTYTVALEIPYFSGMVGGDYPGTIANIVGDNGASGQGADYHGSGSQTGEVALTLPLGIGDQLQSVDIRVVDNHASGQHVILSVWKCSFAAGSNPGSVVQLGSTVHTSSTPTTNVQSLVVGSLAETVVADYRYTALITLGSINDGYLYAAFMTYARP